MHSSELMTEIHKDYNNYFKYMVNSDKIEEILENFMFKQIFKIKLNIN